MKIDDKSGWLFPGTKPSTHDISRKEINQLLELAKVEDKWVENVRSEV